jgi:beta-glucosidase
MRYPLPTAFRRRLLLASTFAGGLVAAALLEQTSCARLQSIQAEISTSDGGSADAFEAPEPDLATMPGEILEPGEKVLEGGLPTVVKAACSDSLEQLSHTRGILPDGGILDISQATGYTPNATIPVQAAALLKNAGNGGLANQMRGTPWNLGGGMINGGDIYRTLDDPNTMIKGILFRDGPRGVNIQSPVFLTLTVNSNAEALGNGYATVFPVSAARAATWDLDLEARIGEDLADEVIATGNDLTISPCVNILRNPAWGRAQETYGEDSFAIGRMGTAYTDGVQTLAPACVKHLAAYNIENARPYNVSVLDNQTLHEIYGRHFEMIVQEAGVACVMASYNSIQMSDGSDTNIYKDTSNPVLLDGMLRKTFGFNGFVMSDFWAMPAFNTTNLMASQYAANAQAAISAGLDLEMPWALNFASIENNPNISTSELQESALRIVEQKLRFNFAATGPSQSQGLYPPPTTSINTNGIIDNTNHLADSELQAEEAMVLLQNKNNVLPINKSSVHSIVVIGGGVPWNLTGTGQNGFWDMVNTLRVGDLGSSRVAPNPLTTVSPLAGIAAAAGSGITVTPITVAYSGPLGTDMSRGGPFKMQSLTEAQVSTIKSADFVVVIAGLTPEDEGEEYTGAGDRIDASGNVNYSLDCKNGSGGQDALISSIAAMGKPMAVVIEAGSAINMPWLSSVPAVVMAWYPGEQGGTALGRLLFGDVNFSGKLPITWPQHEADEPLFDTANSAPGSSTGGSTTMGYYLGYRWFDCAGQTGCAAQGTTQLYAYGSGLSYTTFKYEYLGVPCSTVSQHGVVDVQVAVTNTGTVPGTEVSYLFVSYPQTMVRRSVKELKGFHRTKQPIQPGQTVLFTIPLRVQDLKYWNTANSAWTVEGGPVQIMVGPSSDNLPLMDTLTVTSTQ